MRNIGTNSSHVFFRDDLAMLNKFNFYGHSFSSADSRGAVQVSVDGERMLTKYWLTASLGLAQEQCGYFN